MPNWNQIQAQLRHPANPVVFFDVSVGTTVSISKCMYSNNVFNVFNYLGNWTDDIRIIRRCSTQNK